MCLEELSSKMPFSSQNKKFGFSENYSSVFLMRIFWVIKDWDLWLWAHLCSQIYIFMFSCCDKGAQNVCLSPLQWQNLLFDVGLQNSPMSNLIYYLSPPCFLRAFCSCLISVLIALTGQQMRKNLSLPVYNVSSIHVSQRRSHSKLAWNWPPVACGQCRIV